MDEKGASRVWGCGAEERMTGREFRGWGSGMGWVLRLMESGVECSCGGVDVLTIDRPGGLGDLAALGYKPPVLVVALSRNSQCAQMARFTSGGRFHPGSCRFALVADERPGRATGRVEAS